MLKKILIISAFVIAVSTITVYGSSDISIIPKSGAYTLHGSVSDVGAHMLSLKVAIQINGPVLINRNQWCNLFVECDNLTIHNYKVLGSLVYSDGMDFSGCSNVRVNHVFIRNEDDCIALKQIEEFPDSKGNRDLKFSNMVLWAGISGNAMEIGYGLFYGTVLEDIEFSNVDVIHRQTQASKFNRSAISIHHAGDCTVRNVLYENIRVEESEEQLVDLSYINYASSGDGGGHIENVTIRNLEYLGQNKVPSYFRTQSKKYDYSIDNAVFENFTYQGQAIKSIEDAVGAGFVIQDNVDITFK